MTWSVGPQASWVAEANRGERPEFRPIPGQFNAAALIEDALERSQSSSRFTDDDFAEPLSIFCEALETTAQLTPLGRWATQRYLRRLLAVRLELEAYEAAHLELNDEAIVEPIFVIGPPRSGTTVLHRHLGAVAGHRVARGWEFTRPLPPPDPKTYDHDPRILETADELEFPQAVAAGLRSIHTYSAQMPKECLSAMSFAARTEEFISRYNVPAYVEWLQACDMAPAYAMHRRILHVLQQRMPSARWVLKSPVHLQAVPTLVATYPDASFIVTHREPAEFLASVSSLVATLRSAFSNSVDAVAIGHYHQDLYQRSLNALVGPCGSRCTTNRAHHPCGVQRPGGRHPNSCRHYLREPRNRRRGKPSFDQHRRQRNTRGRRRRTQIPASRLRPQQRRHDAIL